MGCCLSCCTVKGHAFWNASTHTPTQEETLDWMSTLSDDKLLSAVSIPGTHDTMARYGTAFAECQSLSLRDQLNMGIRFLDIRCGHRNNYNDYLPIYHGCCFEKTTFPDCLQVILDFLRDHNKEVIIMRIRNELDEDNHQIAAALYHAIHEAAVYSDFLINGNVRDEMRTNAVHNHFWLKNQIPKLREVRGKIVVLQNFGPNNVTMGIQYSNDNANMFIADKYEFNHDDKLNNIKSHLVKQFDGRIKMTYSSSVGACCIPEFPCLFAKRMNPDLLSYLKGEQSPPHFGIIAMDFPGADLVSEIIKRN